MTSGSDADIIAIEALGLRLPARGRLLGLDLGTKTEQIRFLGEGTFFRGRVVFGAQTSYDIERREVQQRRFRIGYNTQCCGFQLEVLDRGFLGAEGEEYRFMVNLKGVGTVVDFHTGTASSTQTILY